MQVGDIVLNERTDYIKQSRDRLSGTPLTPIARAAGAVELEDFVQRLQANRVAHLRRNVAETDLTNATSFFRDFAPFQLLRRSILPTLIEMKRGQRKLTIWSAACSTGQEAYSLAMMLCEYFPEAEDWDIKIIATDISGAALEYARRGCYRRQEVNRGLPIQMLLKYFERNGDDWRANKKLEAMVEFRSVDLDALPASLPNFDLVLLRNVLLYFPQEKRGRILECVHGKMHPLGVLMLGTAEQAEDSSDLFDVKFQDDCPFYHPRIA